MTCDRQSHYDYMLAPISLRGNTVGYILLSTLAFPPFQALVMPNYSPSQQRLAGTFTLSLPQNSTTRQNLYYERLGGTRTGPGTNM